MRKILIIGSGIFLILVAASLFLHFNPLCGEEVISEEISPDGRYVAVSMQRDCGATTPFVDHINLRLASEKFRHDFLNDTITQGEVFTLGRKHEGSVRFDWVGPRRLEIVHPDSGQSLNHKDVWQEVHIEYPYQHK